MRTWMKIDGRPVGYTERINLYTVRAVFVLSSPVQRAEFGSERSAANWLRSNARVYVQGEIAKLACC